MPIDETTHVKIGISRFPPKGNMALTYWNFAPRADWLDLPAHATTMFDFTRRAMPWPLPKSLTDAEVYALTAFILAGNRIIGEHEVMNAETLPKVTMPNRDGFISRYPEKH